MAIALECHTIRPCKVLTRFSDSPSLFVADLFISYTTQSQVVCSQLFKCSRALCRLCSETQGEENKCSSHSCKSKMQDSFSTQRKEECGSVYIIWCGVRECWNTALYPVPWRVKGACCLCVFMGVCLMLSCAYLWMYSPACGKVAEMEAWHIPMECSCYSVNMYQYKYAIFCMLFVFLNIIKDNKKGNLKHFDTFSIFPFYKCKSTGVTTVHRLFGSHIDTWDDSFL